LASREWWSDNRRVRAGNMALIEAAADDERVLRSIGAGPLERFVHGWDENLLRWVERSAAASSGFRRALLSVWVYGLLPDPVADCIERAAGGRLERPHGWIDP
jgi:hypothetical protein